MTSDNDWRARRRRMVLTIGLGGGLLLLLLGLPTLAQLYVDLRWFRSVGRDDVFTTILSTRWLLGLCVGVVVAALLEINLRLAIRLSKGLPTLQVSDPNLASVDLGRVGPRLLRLLSPLVGLMAGIAASNQWDVWLRFLHGAHFGKQDPIFGRDIAFYVFDLPLLQALYSLGMWVIVLAILTGGATYVLRGGLVWTGRMFTADRRARGHITVLFTLLLGLFAYDAWLDSADLLFSDSGPVAGASYTDVNATLPMLRLKMAAAALGAVLLLVSITRRRLLLVAAAAGLYVAVDVLGVRVYPATVQRFSVDPDEKTKEAPYIEHNIAATRAAYGLDDVEERELDASSTLTMDDIENNRLTIENIRVWDHQPLLETFAQIQEIRTYYDFAAVDNDRYQIGGELRQVMLSPRELSSENLPSRNWINERLTFTHGYGLTLGPVNQATDEGLPVLHIKDMPPKSSIEGMEVTRPAIYFGELSSSYVVVRTENEEFSHPAGDDNVYTSYDGKAGITLDSAWTRLAMAMSLGSMKLLLSDDIRPDSRVLLYRKVRSRAAKLAPFLKLDRDPYMVVRDDGSLAWVQDAYTTTRRYPYAQPAHGVSYIRNSVKVVIDAYDGSVEFYAIQPDDPVLATWSGIFPQMFRPLDEMPEDIRRHLRHPEELFRIQTRMFTTYHMRTPERVYQREDQWEIPSISRGQRVQQLEPYYTIMRLPGEDEAEFIFMLPFTPKRKENLSAWMVARNDGDKLGELMVYRFPRDRWVTGPSQVVNRINQNPEISRQVALWDQRGSQVHFGNLLVIPIEESLIYVSPLYLRSSGGKIPELKRVIVAYGSIIAMERTLDEALEAVMKRVEARIAAGAESPEEIEIPPGEQGPDEVAAPPVSPEKAAVQPEPAAAEAEPREARSRDLRVRAKQIYDRAIERQREGDWAGYGEQLEELQTVLEQLAAEAGRAAGADSAPAEPPAAGDAAAAEPPAGAAPAPQKAPAGTPEPP